MYPRTSLIVPSCNEGEWLERTAASARRYEPAITEILHVDDGSNPPEPDISSFARTLPRRRRMGTARARAWGFCEAAADSQCLATEDAHTLHGPGECLAALLDEQFRIKFYDESKRLAALKAEPDADKWGAIQRQGRQWHDEPPNEECRALLEPDKLSRMAWIVLERNCIGCLPTSRMGAPSLWLDHGLYRAGWTDKREGLMEIACVNGGCYIGARPAWEAMGGYPQLPGWVAYEEETIGMLCAALGIRILAHTGLSPWHQYRGQGFDPVPYPYTKIEDRIWVNWAAAYRLCWPEEMYQQRWKPLIRAYPAAKAVDHRKMGYAIPDPGPFPEHVFEEVESAAFTSYRDEGQEKFRFRGEALLKELERKIAECPKGA